MFGIDLDKTLKPIKAELVQFHKKLDAIQKELAAIRKLLENPK